MPNDDAFAPPAEIPAPPGNATRVLLTWMVCGALIGVTLGITGLVTGAAEGAALIATLASIVGGGMLGLLVYQLERLWTRDRPALIDHRGRSYRPVHALVYLLPIALCVPAIPWLVIVATVAMTSHTVGLLFGTGGFALGWAARRLVARQALAEALQLMELGQIEAAERKLEGIAYGLWSTRGSRGAAHLNLGLVALTCGELDEARKHYEAVRTGAGAGFAQAGLALVHALEDRVEMAEDALLAAIATGTGVQGQTDTVRLLLTLREHGASAARDLGESLLTLEAGELFRGLLAYARLQTGDETGARALADAETREGLEHTWRRVVPEIAELQLALA